MKKKLDQLTLKVIAALERSRLSVRQLSKMTGVPQSTLYSLLSDNRECGMQSKTIEKIVLGIGKPRLGFESNKGKRNVKKVRVPVLPRLVYSRVGEQ